MTPAAGATRWTWETAGRAESLTIVGETCTLEGWFPSTRAVAAAFGHGLDGVPVDVQYEARRLLVRSPRPAGLDASDTLRWTFWEHLAHRELPVRSVLLPDRMRAEISTGGVTHRYDGEGAAAASHQSWDRFLLVGPEAWLLPLELRVELRAMVLGRLAPAAGIGADRAFPLLDYGRVEPGYWEHADGIRGDFVRLERGFVEVGGWDNPRDGGGHSRSLESVLRAPLLPPGLRSVEPELLRRIVCATIGGVAGT